MDYKTVASISTSFILLCLHHRSHYFNGYILAGAEKALESSFCSYNFSIAYAVKFFAPSGSLAVENKPNKVGVIYLTNQAEGVIMNAAIASQASLIDVLCGSVAVLWRDWPRPMEVASAGEGGFVLTGECPHCCRPVAFTSVGRSHTEEQDGRKRMIGALQCCGCHKYILGIICYSVPGPSPCRWFYEAHYPLGEPNDSVSEHVPETIAADFKEALRCHWVKAYNATAEMCRRTVQATCIKHGATGKSLGDQIDGLAAKGIITAPLKDMAQAVRLGGNRGAHASDAEGPIGPEDAEALIEFTNHLLQHVYVMPGEMKKFDFSRSGRKAKAPGSP